MTIAIGDEIRESSALAEKMNDSFDATRLRLKGTMNRMLVMAEKTGVGWKVWLLFFVAVMYVVPFLFLSLSLSSSQQQGEGRRWLTVTQTVILVCLVILREIPQANSKTHCTNKDLFPGRTSGVARWVIKINKRG